MQLKYENTVKNRVITLEMETANFNQREIAALEKFGEPVITFEKMYNGKFPVSISKKIRTGFKVRVKFDGTEDMDGAAEAASAFFEEIEEMLAETMRDLMDQLIELESGFEAKKGFIDIKY